MGCSTRSGSPGKATGLDADEFWDHSVITAVAARLILSFRLVTQYIAPLSAPPIPGLLASQRRATGERSAHRLAWRTRRKGADARSTSLRRNGGTSADATSATAMMMAASRVPLPLSGATPRNRSIQSISSSQSAVREWSRLTQASFYPPRRPADEPVHGSPSASAGGSTSSAQVPSRRDRLVSRRARERERNPACVHRNVKRQRR